MFLCAFRLILLAGIATTAAPSDWVQEFQQRDQALLDAVAPGDVTVWDAVLAPEAVYVDEEGNIMKRADFLKELKPLPAGVTGNIRISSYSALENGDVVTVVHTDDESEIYHGQHLAARYLTTETWQRQNGAWKLLLVHVYSFLNEPKTITLSSGELDAYVGRYSAAPELTYTIRRDGDHLVGEREGRPAATLKPELHDVFFMSGQLRTRKVFERDDAGRIVGFVDRRDGTDLVWKKIP